MPRELLNKDNLFCWKELRQEHSSLIYRILQSLLWSNGSLFFLILMGSGALLSLCFIWYGKKPYICISINNIWLIFFGYWARIHQLSRRFIFSGAFQSETDLRWSCSWKGLLIWSASLIIFPHFPVKETSLSVWPRWDEAVFTQKTYFKLLPVF